MKRLVFCVISLIVVASMAGEAKSQGMPFSLGVRMGVNMSSQDINMDKLFVGVKESSIDKKTGGHIGVVIDMQLSSKVTLQPGFFIKRHAYDYFNASIVDGGKYIRIATGEARYNTYHIPILVSYRLNLSAIEWQLDMGPYIAFGNGGNNKVAVNEISIDDGIKSKEYKYKNDFYGDSDGVIIGCDNFDWGVKLGAGVKLLGTYYVGVHYNAGLRNVGKKHEGFLKNPSVKNRCWDFTFGYSF